MTAWGHLDPAEWISRFIHHARDWSRAAHLAKPSAFDPGNHPELSVAHIGGLAEQEIWNLSRHTLSDQPGREAVLARADLRAGIALAQGLSAVRDNDPFERHTTISGWPKDERKRIALELSQAAEL
ncbi:MAG TPA: hypothetical protein VNL71_12345, partial [Chloroflexota bacterium]|nr:hypothetical protein [Chloroflexota bacterium]